MEINETLENDLAKRYQELINIKDKFPNIVEVLDHQDGQKVVDEILKQPDNKNLLKDWEGYLFLLSNGMIFSFFINDYFESIIKIKINSKESYLQGSLDMPVGTGGSFKDYFISQTSDTLEINFDLDKYKYPFKTNNVVIGFSVKIEEWRKHLNELESISGEIYKIIYPSDHFLKCNRDSSIILDDVLNHKGSIYAVFYSEEDKRYHYTKLERRLLNPNKDTSEIGVYNLIDWLISSWYLTFNLTTASRVTKCLNELCYLYSCWIGSGFYRNKE